jgi:hypothetical protein
VIDDAAGHFPQNTLSANCVRKANVPNPTRQTSAIQAALLPAAPRLYLQARLRHMLAA